MTLIDTSNLIHSGSLALENGHTWSIVACNGYGVEVANFLARSMLLKPMSTIGSDQQLLVIKDTCSEDINITTGKNEPTVCQLASVNGDDFVIQLMQLSLVISSQVEKHGGILIHGALAEKDGKGIILAGPGGVGKTTASRRLPPPWISHSDDCTLIVRDKHEVYHAHPWPTWSNFMFGGDGGAWDVQHSIPLEAIFILTQNDKERVEIIEQGQAVCLLNESAEQAWYILSNDLDDNKKQAMNLQRFNNICELTKNIPSYLLHLSENGSFWKEIEQVLSNKNS
jgi:SynChlorMet cassette protein ScmC